MASAVSYEYLSAQKGAASGIASLDANTKIPVTQLPSVAISNFKGTYATANDLPAAAESKLGDYAYVTAATSFYYFNSALSTPAWVNQQISAADYGALTAQQKSIVPYIITG